MRTPNSGSDSSGVSAEHSPRFLRSEKLWLLRHNVFSIIKQYPIIHIPLNRLLSRINPFYGAVVGERTELVIEGFPRSGNSFAFYAFSNPQPRPVVIGHHTHAPAQVEWATKRGIPTLVLIRRPADAVLSGVIFSPAISLRQSLKDYIRFYTRIKPHRSRYVVATFDDVTSDFGEVVERINRRFAVKFTPFEHNEKNVNEVFRLVEQTELRVSGRTEVTETKVARPSRERERIKAGLEIELAAEGLKDLLRRANALYREFAGPSN